MLRSPSYKNVKKIILVSIRSCRYLLTLLYVILLFIVCKCPHCYLVHLLQPCNVYAWAQPYHPGSGGSHGHLFRLYLGSSAWPGARPCWWVPMRTKQLSMAANTTGVIWLCACVRYWPYRGVGTCVSVLKLVWLKQLSRYLSPWQAPFPAPPTQTIVGSCTLSPAFLLQVLLSTTGT